MIILIGLCLVCIMGTAFSLPDTLTESQKRKAKLLGITEDEMIARLRRINNMETPTVSIIIPVYNGEKYIRECVQSCLNQTYDSYEIIVIDDGSTDNTLNILCEFDFITVLIKPNSGTASALNTGIKNAKGQWIKWLSADDVLYPDAIENMMKSVSDDNTIYYTNYHIIDSDSNITGQFVEPNRDTNQLWSLFFGNGSSSMIHRKVFEKCGNFDDSLAHSEDYEFWLRATQVYGVKMELIPFFSLKYRRHPDQLTNRVGGSLDSLIKNKIKSLIETTSSEGQPTVQHPTG